MPEIPPIGDAYIDDIIKAVDPFDPNLNKTQGIKLRELVKLMRDRVEQQTGMNEAMKHEYTEVTTNDMLVSPNTYFDHPNTLIVNRNNGLDAIINFESYAALQDTGKIYHIKNMGLVPAVLTSTSGAFFDGELSITLLQYDSVTIMSANLTDSTAGRWVVMSSKVQAVTESNLLPGMSRISMRSDLYIESSPHIWSQITGGTGFISMNYTIDNDGQLFSKYVEEKSYVGDWSIMKEYNSGDYVNVYITGGYVKWEATDMSADQEPAVLGTWYGFQKVGNNIKLVKTVDGMNYNTIVDYGSRPDYNYVCSWYYGGGSVLTYYPQGTGLNIIAP